VFAGRDPLYAHVRATGGKCRYCWRRIRRDEPPLRAGVRYRPRPGAEEAVHEPDCARGWPVSASAVREMHTVLSGAFKQAVVWGWTAQNPAKLATPPAAGRAEVAPPDAEGVARLLTAAAEQDPELGLFLRLAVVLGARRSELIALKWRDVDLGRGEMLIASGVVRVAGQPLIDKDTKTHAKRRVAVGSGAAGPEVVVGEGLATVHPRGPRQRDGETHPVRSGWVGPWWPAFGSGMRSSVGRQAMGSKIPGFSGTWRRFDSSPSLRPWPGGCPWSWPPGNLRRLPGVPEPWRGSSQSGDAVPLTPRDP
jgi:hypothetical protein